MARRQDREKARQEVGGVAPFHSNFHDTHMQCGAMPKTRGAMPMTRGHASTPPEQGIHLLGSDSE